MHDHDPSLSSGHTTYNPPRMGAERAGIGFWVLLLLVGGVTVSRGVGAVVKGVAFVDGKRAVGVTDEDYVCATVDWWPSTKCDYGSCSWGRSSLLNLNLSSPILLNVVKAFSPLKLRLGGTLQDNAVYDIGDSYQPCYDFVQNDSLLFGFSRGCLSSRRWDELNEFFRKSGASVIFGLNALNGRVPLPGEAVKGSWNSSNAAALIRYTVEKGYHVQAWEFGNELSGTGIGTSIEADQYAADVIRLKHIVYDIYRAFPTKPLIATPGGLYDAVWYGELVNRTKQNNLDVITHHIYNLGPGVDNHLIEKILNPDYLDGVRGVFGDLQGMLRRAMTKTVAWVSESGGAYNSGHDLVTNAFVFSFWYLDQLGMAASYDTKTYCRQSLIGGNYGLLDTTTYLPNPSYYSALLWHRLMGQNALQTNFTGSKNVRVYAHCSKQSKGITVLLMNLDRNTTAHITMERLQDRPAPASQRISPGSIREEYHLSAENGNLQSRKVLLNGKLLTAEKNGRIPALKHSISNASNSIVIAPLSIVFAHIPDFPAPVCRRAPFFQRQFSIFYRSRRYEA